MTTTQSITDFIFVSLFLLFNTGLMGPLRVPTRNELKARALLILEKLGFDND